MNNEETNNPVPPTVPQSAPENETPTPPSVEPSADVTPPVGDTPTPPISSDMPQPPAQSAPDVQPQATQNHTDGLGIASIIMAFVGLQLIGLILGLMGASKAKKEGHSPTLSRVGWILNLVFLGFVSLLLAGLVLSNFSGAQGKARDTERITDVNAIYVQLEVFYNTNGYYPPVANTTTLPTVDPEAFKDPKGGSYTYTPSPTGCKECASYVISTKLDKPSSLYPTGDYNKQSLNDRVDKTITPSVPSSNL